MRERQRGPGPLGKVIDQQPPHGHRPAVVERLHVQFSVLDVTAHRAAPTIK